MFGRFGKENPIEFEFILFRRFCPELLVLFLEIEILPKFEFVVGIFICYIFNGIEIAGGEDKPEKLAAMFLFENPLKSDVPPVPLTTIFPEPVIKLLLPVTWFAFPFT
jgi:hypothetical protein